MIFQCETTKTLDQAGNLAMVSVNWTEARRGTESFMIVCSVMSYMVGGAMALFGYALSSGQSVVLGVGLLIAGYAMTRGSVFLDGRPRVMQFHRGGTIVTPLWTAIAPRHTAAWRAKHGDIANVEAEQLERPTPDEINDYTHGVRMILRHGKVVHIAKYLMPDDAHQLAVQLTAAVAEIRLDIGGQLRQGDIRHDVLID